MMNDLAERLRSWAQNEEMIDQYFTDHGKDCLDAIKRIEELTDELVNVELVAKDRYCEMQQRIEELEGKLDTYRRWHYNNRQQMRAVHEADSPYEAWEIICQIKNAAAQESDDE